MRGSFLERGRHAVRILPLWTEIPPNCGGIPPLFGLFRQTIGGSRQLQQQSRQLAFRYLFKEDSSLDFGILQLWESLGFADSADRDGNSANMRRNPADLPIYSAKLLEDSANFSNNPANPLF
jgi:hypothetical protein